MCSRSTCRIRTNSTRGCIAASAKGGTSSAAVPRPRGHLQVHRRRRDLDEALDWPPQPLIGKIDIDIARSQPNIVYAMIEAPGDQGGLYRSDDSGATWRIVNSAGNLRSRPFYFNYVDVNEEPRRSVGERARDVSPPTAARRSHPSARRTATTTASGSTLMIR